MNSTRSIRINLDQIGNPAIAPRGEGFIQHEARQRVFSALVNFDTPVTESQDDAARPRELDIIKDRRHDAILVSARRGEGKTTFLTNVLESIQDGTYRILLDQSAPAAANPAKNLYSLGVIDPTLIETKQNIVIVVIDRIRIATEHRRKHYSNLADEYAAVKKSLRKLAQGLSLLDGIGDSLYGGREWLDPDFILDQGLLNASAAHDFERSFRHYVAKAAHYVGCDAFVLAIDDVDTWFEKGWPVLEALRKYLATPQLRIILSGDLNLYSLLIRRQQWAQMGKDFITAEESRGNVDAGMSQVSKIGHMVDALQDQYLVKVAPPENRIDLRPLEYHVRQASLELESNRLSAPMPEGEFIERMAGRLLGLNAKPDVALFRQQLLSLPTRSSLQALAGAVELCGASADSSVVRRAVDTFRHVAWTSLMGLGIDIDATRDPSPDLILGLLARWLTQSNRWLDLARFHPDTTDPDRNLVAIYLAAVLTEVFRRSPGRMLEFWLKIATLREKIDRGEVGDDGARGGSLPRLMDHLNANTVENAAQFVSRLAAWEVTEGGRDRIRRIVPSTRLSGATVPIARIRETRAATIELYGLEYAPGRGAALDREAFRNVADKQEAYQKRLFQALPPPLRGYHSALIRAGWSYDSRRGAEAGFQVYFANGIEDLAERLDRNARLVALLPSSRIVSSQQADYGNYSFLRLLGVIAELLDATSVTDAAERRQRVAQTITALSQARSYPTPSAVEAERRQAAADYEPDEELESDSGPGQFAPSVGDELEDLIVAWLDAHSLKNVALAPITLSRMWTRFTYAFGNMRDELVHGQSRYLGVFFHRTIIAFLHAVGFEALRAANFAPGRSLANNPVRSGEVFVRLLSEIYDSDDRTFQATPEFDFFDAIFSCPIWAYFLARNEEEEVDKPRRGEPNDSIFQHYSMRVGQYLESDIEFAKVLMGSPKPSESTAKFEGLFFPLNTVQLQGGGDINGRAGGRLKSFMDQQKPKIRRRPGPAADEADSEDGSP
ncbi:hypothetical protein [Phenylobacterium montanum]|uniref:Uncharacterized protein n=1 Tax=Phenylobacterium montanum TaxID=2823693 RepID=A0A975FVG7_9CAUL|nr:hypothetical protein [Caulobacter sp. S6]QUD86050.1 hypothetical protein KCG34_13140 [Caulobacter sp. S6]